MQHFHDLRQTLCIVLPENDNHGVPIAPALYDLLESVFEAVAGGWSCTPSCRGSWVNDKGDQYTELNRSYEVTVSNPRDIETLRRVMHKFCSVIDQDIVYIRVQRSVVFFDRIQRAELSVTETLPHWPVTTNGHGDVLKNDAH
jgi:hypothetical protein